MKGGAILEAELIQEYKNVSLTKEIVEMFADIIQEDEWMFEVFYYIVKRRQDEKDNFIGVTVNEISKDVKLERPVKVIKGKHTNFEIQTTNIHRQAAGKIVDKLLAMSLLSYKPLTPYKYFFLTKRGLQVIKEIVDRKNNHIGDESSGEIIY
jgi:hypothetical protein